MSLRLRLLDQIIGLRPRDWASVENLRAATIRAGRTSPVPRWVPLFVKVSDVGEPDHRILRVEPRKPGTPARGSAVKSTGTKTGTTAEFLYFHGGGYVFPMVPLHWVYLVRLVRRTGVGVTLPDYPLAPEHTVDDAVKIWDEAIAVATEQAGNGKLFFAGDSAGGGATFVAGLRCRDQGWRLPDALIGLSPWVDASLSNPAAWANEPLDRMLAGAGVSTAGIWWAGGRSLTDPIVSPLHGDLAGFPPITIFQGSRDILAPDARLFTTKARAAGVAVNYVEEPDGPHDYALIPGTPEYRRAQKTVSALVRS